MSENRIIKHPILEPQDSSPVWFSWNHRILQGLTTDTIASALIANGIHIFGHHPKDDSPQGIFCANGQCAQCTVLVNGIPKKACMTALSAGMEVTELNQNPVISFTSDNTKSDRIGMPVNQLRCTVLIIGGGPAGLSAAIQLGQHGVDTILVDDKHQLGGKLVLQTHRFFGSAQEVYAGKRGVEIAKILDAEVRKFPSIHIWNAARAVGVFSDHKIGVVDGNDEYHLIAPDILLVATGARENSLIFPGNTLPGVFGAGAFQTLINRDRVKPADHLFIVGGGNVGLIAGYHALQAGINIVGLIEAAPVCGGYQVHELKLARLGAPILTSHTIISANGTNHVESITIAKCNPEFQPIKGTEQTIPCDAILVAVGLSPVNEFLKKAQEFNMNVFSAGDAEIIAEASAAMISGKIKAYEILHTLGMKGEEDFSKLKDLAEKLRARPGKTSPHAAQIDTNTIQPVLHCYQEIPCNPCSSVCPLNNIHMTSNNILETPVYQVSSEMCINCERCLTICPGLAITIVDMHLEDDSAVVSLPFEFDESLIQDQVMTVDDVGNKIGYAKVLSVKAPQSHDHTRTVKLKVPIQIASKIAGIRIQEKNGLENIEQPDQIPNETIVCRCERVTAGEIRSLIEQGVTDINEIKALTRAGMGACGSKTCHNLILQLFREAGISGELITRNTDRPLFYETELSILAGMKKHEEDL